MHDDELWTDNNDSFDHKTCQYCGKNKLICTCVTGLKNDKKNEETEQVFWGKKRIFIVCSVVMIISRRGKHRIALWKAPFCFTESSRAQRGKHEN